MEQGGEGGARLLPKVLVTKPFSKKDGSDFLGAFVLLHGVSGREQNG